jgi:hypothetical protein
MPTTLTAYLKTLKAGDRDERVLLWRFARS